MGDRARADIQSQTFLALAMAAQEGAHNVPHTPRPSVATVDDDPFQAFVSAARSSLPSSPSSGEQDDYYQPSHPQWQQLPETPTEDPFADDFAELGSEDVPVDVIRELQRDARRSNVSYETLTIIICEGAEEDDPLDLVDLVFAKASTPARAVGHKHAPSDPFVVSGAPTTEGVYIRPLPTVEDEGEDDSEPSLSVSDTFEHIQRRMSR